MFERRAASCAWSFEVRIAKTPLYDLGRGAVSVARFQLHRIERIVGVQGIFNRERVKGATDRRSLGQRLRLGEVSSNGFQMGLVSGR